MKIIEVLKNNDFVWLALTICNFVSVLLAIYFGRKSLAQKTIQTTICNNELITNDQSNISKVKILYDDKSIDKLTVTKFTFWNNSLPTIYPADIIDAEPLSIFTNNGMILEVSVLKGDDTPNRISVSIVNNTTANIAFDYLDKGEGGIIQIIHTGTSINVTRKIKGGHVKSAPRLFKLAYPITMVISEVIVLIVVFNYPKSIMLFFGFIIIFGIIGVVYSFNDPSNYTPKNCK